jgi:hypothetical protein
MGGRAWGDGHHGVYNASTVAISPFRSLMMLYFYVIYLLDCFSLLTFFLAATQRSTVRHGIYIITISHRKFEDVR